METQKIRRHYQIYGQVQGVGFRYRAGYGARHLGLTGWVRNNSDGSVTMELQGFAAQIDQLLQLLSEDSYIQIGTVQCKEIQIEVEERSFSVRY